MRIRWIRQAPGVYVSDSGRFAIRKSDPGWYGRFEWCITDCGIPVNAPDSLKKAKKRVDNILTAEEAHNA